MSNKLELYMAAADNTLYLAKTPEQPEDKIYIAADEYILLAVQLYPRSTIPDLLPHITLLKQNKHPEQIRSKGSVRTIPHAEEMLHPSRIRAPYIEEEEEKYKKKDKVKELAEAVPLEDTRVNSPPKTPLSAADFMNIVRGNNGRE